MQIEWVKVFSTKASYLVELVKGILEKESIQTVVVNKQDSMYSPIFGEIELYVNREDVLKAKHLISKTEFWQTLPKEFLLVSFLWWCC